MRYEIFVVVNNKDVFKEIVIIKEDKFHTRKGDI